jgi:MazG family protein
MARLRDPESGCPWDVQQTFRTIAPYTIEEAYEVAAAIDRNDLVQLRDELGDLLLQVVFHTRMAEEAGAFNFEAVAAAIVDKMVRRHPHVFGDAEVTSAEAQTQAWESHKAEERERAGEQGVLGGISRGLPALLRAQKLGKRAARVGFDWPDAAGARVKVAEELAELEQAQVAADGASIEDEMGDVLFAVANLARKLGVNPEEALRRANSKFERRFAHVEQAVHAAGGDWTAFDLDDLEEFWSRAKAADVNPAD